MDSDVEAEAKAANRARFELELEFVQALANPFYLHSLAQQNILEQPAFVNFLEYLLYFKEKDYARFIQYVCTIWNIISSRSQYFKLSTRTSSFRAPSTCAIPFSVEKRRVSEGISSSKAI
jgi:mediator of RNA polymerase II transcription subunit 31